MRPEVRPRGVIGALILSSAILLVCSLWIRALDLRPRGVRASEPTSTTIPEPMQLLSKNARERLDARWIWIAKEHEALWSRVSHVPFDLRGCPRTSEWLAGANGHDVEQLIDQLTHGNTSEEALSALALLFQIARATSWKSGMIASGVDAAKLGDLLEKWLVTWAPTSAHDSTLGEPARAALCLWGRAAREAIRAPIFGRDEAIESHARVVLDGLLKSRGASRTAFGEEFAQQFPRAVSTLAGDGDFLRGLADDAARLFPEIDGVCGQ